MPQTAIIRHHCCRPTTTAQTNRFCSTVRPSLVSSLLFRRLSVSVNHVDPFCQTSRISSSYLAIRHSLLLLLLSCQRENRSVNMLGIASKLLLQNHIILLLLKYKFVRTYQKHNVHICTSYAYIHTYINVHKHIYIQAYQPTYIHIQWIYIIQLYIHANIHIDVQIFSVNIHVFAYKY